MTLVYIAAGMLVVWLLIQLWPVSSLTYVDMEEWDPSHERWSNVKILDVRDSSEYWESHIPGSINISIGRLPWQKELSRHDEVIIFSSTWLKRKKAARILARRGFRQLYMVKGYCLSKKGKGESIEHKYCY
ncbi:rhodanese-like domain-containing protein [Paenibacillus illinoisensis]|uniref:Hydroxyacylglutathione hydrolase n=1 Tax=Paenibacillus illinoisensis TaxID=59845 RepID=A0A2W0CQJ3_9BACL|nr:rhodanese-like domain-containing protein [Paenibacillus illinoisensis]PYY25951.1 hydroxyacylglutathione hydrolase [Paenibacillus illinoisensis]